MGKFDSILDKLQKSASDRDAETAQVKCPKKRKPAIFVAVARSDTGDPVGSVKVEISKPTQQALSTNRDGEVKLDPAKLGQHLLKIVLTDEQKKKFAAPRPLAATTAKGQTSVNFFLLETLPTLLVEVKDLDGNKPADGIKVQCGRLPERTTAGGKVDFGGIAAGRYRTVLVVPKPLETKVEVFSRGASVATFEPGYPIEWTVDLAAGDAQSFQVTVARVRTVEFVLAEQGTDRAIAGAKLHVKLPGGGKAIAVTDHTGSAKVTFSTDGKVEIERVEVNQPGSVVKVQPL